MSAIGILLIGIGAYLMYDAVKSTTPAPVTNAKTALGKVSGSSTTTTTADQFPEPTTVFTNPGGGAFSLNG